MNNDKLKTMPVACKGGLVLTADPLSMATQLPGSATFLINYEPAQRGGYRRIGGYEKFDSAAPTGSGTILGVAVFNGGVLAARGDSVYFSTGSGWSAAINSPARTGAVRYRFVRYNYSGTPRIIMVDEVNPAARWDGATYTLLNAANSPANPKYVEEFQNHIFYSGYTSNTGAIKFSVPLDETDFDVADGAGEIVVGDTVVGLKRFRNELIIFCENSIFKLTGSSSANFALEPITKEIGCVSSDSIQEIGGDLVYLAPDGVRPLGGTARIGDVQIASISRQIQPVISGENITSFSNITSVVIPSLSMYRLFYNNTDVTAADARGIAGSPLRGEAPTPASGGWEWAELVGIKPFTMDFAYNNDEEYAIFGGWDGYVYRLEQGSSFDGADITALYRTAPLIMEDPNLRKTVHALKVAIYVEDDTQLQISAIYDLQDTDTTQPDAITLDLDSILTLYGTGVYGTAVYGSNPSTLTRKLYVEGSGMYIQFSFYSSGVYNSHTIQSFTVEYLMIGKR